VFDDRGPWALLGKGLSIQPVFENGFDALVAHGVDGQSPLACGLESLGTVVFSQAQDAQTGPVTLLGMGA